jgi:hypothetical protein
MFVLKAYKLDGRIITEVDLRAETRVTRYSPTQPKTTYFPHHAMFPNIPNVETLHPSRTVPRHLTITRVNSLPRVTNTTSVAGIVNFAGVADIARMANMTQYYLQTALNAHLECCTRRTAQISLGDLYCYYPQNELLLYRPQQLPTPMTPAIRRWVNVRAWLEKFGQPAAGVDGGKAEGRKDELIRRLEEYFGRFMEWTPLQQER